ncbi:TIGR02444 family protein [Nitrincola tibetensis]|uniref:TIGR02444 family protein n=1 Tax=Nitrincola tibetensis TaxID=2219697 RepID=A0A364NJ27_9GAMM|nr:TIGR02444 family protein [Nitrincola tibetensis]RAU16895.1 TIGR02444 family protein [Nitrincola tibetensis]
MIYNNPLWDYALKLYRQAGVEDICLSLQAQGIQVNPVLFACWLAHKRKPFPKALNQDVLCWQTELLAPLRALRYRFRQSDWRRDYPECYQAFKQAELEAERIDLYHLWQLSQTDTQCLATDTCLEQIMQDNIDAYIQSLEIEPRPIKQYTDALVREAIKNKPDD